MISSMKPSYPDDGFGAITNLTSRMRTNFGSPIIIVYFHDFVDLDGDSERISHIEEQLNCATLIGFDELILLNEVTTGSFLTSNVDLSQIQIVAIRKTEHQGTGGTISVQKEPTAIIGHPDENRIENRIDMITSSEVKTHENSP
jgi:hypothetical protein